MGMYDNIDFKIECPICQKEVTGFQSKDRKCDLETLNYWEVDNFYTSCDYCNTWIEFYREQQRPYVPIQHYGMKVELNNVAEERIMRNSDGKIIGFSGMKK